MQFKRIEISDDKQTWHISCNFVVGDITYQMVMVKTFSNFNGLATTLELGSDPSDWPFSRCISLF